MSLPNDEKQIRRGALLLSALVLTKDDGLVAFREQRVADPRVTDEQLIQARTVLHAISHALQGSNRDNWKRVEEAFRILRRNEPPKANEPASSSTAADRGEASTRASAPATRGPRPLEAAPERVEAPNPSPRPSLDFSVPSSPAPVVSPPRSESTSSPWVVGRAPASMPGGEPPSVPAPSSPEREESLGETFELDPAMFAHLAAPTPFHGSSGPPPSARGAEEEADFAGETSAFDPDTFAHLTASTPFADGPASAADVDMGETAALDPAMFAHLAEPTPFQEGQATPPPSAVDASDFAGETSTLDPASIAGVVAAYPLPSTELPMTVERYAALVARSEKATEAELAVLHREYGLADAAHRKRIDQEFSEAFTRDGMLRQQFADYLRQGRDWLRRQRGG